MARTPQGARAGEPTPLSASRVVHEALPATVAERAVPVLMCLPCVSATLCSGGVRGGRGRVGRGGRDGALHRQVRRRAQRLAHCAWPSPRSYAPWPCAEPPCAEPTRRRAAAPGHEYETPSYPFARLRRPWRGQVLPHRRFLTERQLGALLDRLTEGRRAGWPQPRWLAWFGRDAEERAVRLAAGRRRSARQQSTAHLYLVWQSTAHLYLVWQSTAHLYLASLYS